MKHKLIALMVMLAFSIQGTAIAAESIHINRNILVDKTAPLAPVLTGVPPAWVNKDVQILVDNLVDPVSNGVSSGVKQVDYEINGVQHSNPGSAEFQIAITDEGNHNLSVKAVDMVGHVGPEAVGAVKIDKTAPVITVTGIDNNETYYSSVSPVYSAADAGGSGLAGCTATIAKDGGTPTPFTSGTAVNTPGNYTLVVNASDTATNTASRTMQFNLSAPVAPEQPTTAALTPQSVKVEWTAVQGATGYQLMDGVTQIADVTELSYIHEGLLPNTVHQYKVVAYNPMGNSPASPEKAVFTLSNDPANLQVTGKTSTSLAFSWEANGNPEGTEYAVSITDGAGYIDTVPFTANLLAHEFTGLVLGKEYTISAKARNGDEIETAGVNIEASTNKAPELTISAPETGTAYSQAEGYNIITVSGTVSDEDNDSVTVTASVYGITRSVVIEDCQGGKPYSISLDAVALPEGSHTIEVIADDGR
ncbi:fibronectin type III domain-containing protein [Syntrophomonas curvata]